MFTLHTYMATSEEPLFEICQVPNYKKVVYKQNPEKKTPVAVRINEPIQTIVDALKCDKCFHERLFKNDILKLNIDIDKITFKNPNTSFEVIINEICEYLNISVHDISYTTNFSVDTGSHHVVIPKYYMPSMNQKKLWEKFKKDYKHGEEIDYGHLGSEHWFRLPNQTKQGEPNTQHIIQKGILEDFVLKYIPSSNCSEFIQNISSPDEPPAPPQQQQQKRKKSKSSTTKKKELLVIIEDDLDEEKEDEWLDLLFNVIGNKNLSWDNWFLIKGIVKSNGYEFNVFDNFSKISKEKYDKNNTIELWKSDTSYKLSLHSLQSIAKTQNPKGYKHWIVKYNKFLGLDVLCKGANDIAKYIKHQLIRTLVFCKEKWYTFDVSSGLWRTLKEPTQIVVEYIQRQIDESREVIMKRKLKEDDAEKKKELENVINLYGKFYSDVNDAKICNQIIKMLKEQLLDNELEDKLDSMKYKVAFKNGIFNLQTLSFEKRIGCEDFITETIPSEYSEPSKTDVDWVRENIKKITNYNENHLE